MRCPKCGAPSRVLRPITRPGSVERRRQCTKCRNRFRTLELLAVECRVLVKPGAPLGDLDGALARARLTIELPAA